MALPVGKNLSIYQGDSFEMSFVLYQKNLSGGKGNPVDLTGAEVSAQVRATPTSDQVLVELDGSHNGIGGKVTLKLTPAETSALPITGGVWDVQLQFPNGDVRTYLAGAITVLPEVTRL